MSVAVARLEAPPGFLGHVGASPERLADVERFRGMLVAGNARMNLVGSSTLAEFWRRHFVDSAQLRCFAPQARVWADLGSGAGLPGMILAILLKNESGACVHLVESTQKRCRFLAAAARELELPVVIHNARAETLELNVQVVTARACAPLDRLLGFARPYLARGATGLFLKGGEVEAELATARKTWRFSAAIHQSVSDPRGRILEISEFSSAR
jgi:16S rRNA (guanine527-N7)-methyltransferase